jgi:hypothetical protein
MARATDIEALLIWAFRDQAVETTRNPPEDALTVYWAVMALPEPHGSMVRQAARDGVAPDWRRPHGPVISLAKVRKARSAYTDWVQALVVLQRTLEGALHNFRAYGPAAAEEPWKLTGNTSGTLRRALRSPRWSP